MPERTHKDREILPACASIEMQAVITDLGNDLAIYPDELDALERLLGEELRILLQS